MIQQPINQPAAFVPPYNPSEHPAYPSTRFHRSGKTLKVNSAEEEPQGEDWAKSPFPKQAATSLAAVAPTSPTPEEELKAKFNAAWEAQSAELLQVQMELTNLQRDHEELQEAYHALVAKQEEATVPRKKKPE